MSKKQSRQAAAYMRIYERMLEQQKTRRLEKKIRDNAKHAMDLMRGQAAGVIIGDLLGPERTQTLEKDISSKLEVMIEEMEGQPADQFMARLRLMPDDQRAMLLLMIDHVTKGPPEGLKRLADLRERLKASREPASVN